MKIEEQSGSFNGPGIAKEMQSAIDAKKAEINSLNNRMTEAKRELAALEISYKYLKRGLKIPEIAKVSLFWERSKKSNSQEVLKQIIKDSPEISTTEVRTEYAQRMNSTPEAVRQFVDTTLSRLTKLGTLERTHKAGKGSVYKWIDHGMF